MTHATPESAANDAVGGLAANADPVAQLRTERPELFEAPPFWRSTLADIESAARTARRAKVEILGHSAGGRPIHAFSFGAFEPQQPTATISSAWASDRPEVFFDPAQRTRPTLLLIGSIHGGETEGIAAAMNVIRLLDAEAGGGADEHGMTPALRDRLEQVRLVVVPCLNPDGRERAGVAHLVGAEREHLFLVQQGVRQDGTPLAGRRVKEVQPIDPATMRFLGGYYNDAGVNLQHDDFFGGELAPENRALAELIRREIPDGLLTFHAHGTDPALLGPDAYMSPGYQRRQLELSGFIAARFAERELPLLPPQRCVAPPWSFTLQCFAHHAAGLLPMLCELPHGLRGRPYTQEQILRIAATVVDAWADFALRVGLRPTSFDLNGPVSPA